MELIYRLYMRTRSSDRDYFWVGGTPEEWWTTWGSSLLRRQPSLLRDTIDRRERIFLSRAVSSRRDGSSSRTLIRYDLALVADRTATSSGISGRQVDWLIGEWFAQRTLGAQSTWPLGAKIDALLESAAERIGVTVDSLLENESPAVVTAVQDLPGASVARSGQGAVEPAVTWIGSANPKALSYLCGAPKLAYFVGTTPKDAKRGLALADDVVIVVDGDAGEHGRESQGASVPKAPAAPSPRKVDRTHQLRLVGTMVLILLAVVAASALALLLA